MAFLKVFAQGEERTIFLAEDPVVVGRDKTCDVMLADLKASRLHCTIEPHRQGGWRVRDLGSGNGTKVNGKKVDRHVLRPDDVVEIGDARILFAGEAASVAAEAAASVSAARPGGRNRNAPPPAAKRSSKTAFAVVGAALLLAAALYALFGGKRGNEESEELLADYREAMTASQDEEIVRLGDAFLKRHPDSVRVPEVRAAVEAARVRVRQEAAEPDSGYDPTPELTSLTAVEAIEKLESMLDEAEPARRPGIRRVLERYRTRVQEARESTFAGIEKEFRELVALGQFARARELWFFLAGQEDWQPIPQPYPERIVEANRELENTAAAERSRILEEVARAEAAHDFAFAIGILERELPRFAGTSVERSLRESLAFQREALARGVSGAPTQPASLIRLDVGEKMKALLARMGEREFAAAAAGLDELAEQVRERKDRGADQVLARARECGAAAALHAALVADLDAGRLPTQQVLRRWRIVAGDADGLTVRTRGEESRFAWKEVPADLHLALLERQAPNVQNGALGLVVAAYALGGETALLPVLATAYAGEAPHPELDAFVAGRLRAEAVPEGGYVVHEGAILTRKEYLRKQEEELILRLQGQLQESYDAIRNDRIFRKLDKLKEKKDALDKARAYALELIYDEKTYFYPYRGTGREGEYWKVQAAVDARVAPVREMWDDRATVHVKASPELAKRLEAFDQAAAELEKRLVDVRDKVEEVAFLRSYFGRKLNVRTLFRTPEELDLLRYSDEVMEFNTQVKGDITDVEREQVRITNEYRMMFGRWPVRLVEKLVLSSRGHCEEMSRLGYFGHFSPTPGRRTPYDRMKLQGYEYGSSENCIMGRTGPQAAHDGWCHSSGHHRNLLMADWTEMGTGHHGRYMTQNFGQAPRWSKHDKDEPEAERPLRPWEIEDWGGEEEGEGDKPSDEDDEFDYGDEE